MRTFFGVVAAGAIWLAPQAAAACGCCDHHHDEHAQTSSAAKSQLGPDEARVTIPVTGMHCGNCVARVEAALVKVHGVKVAEANLANSEAVVIVEKGKVDSAKLTAAIDALGFKAGAPAHN